MNDEKGQQKNKISSQLDAVNLQATQRHPFFVPDEAEQNSQEYDETFQNHFRKITRKI